MQFDAGYLNNMLDMHLLTIFVVNDSGHDCLFCGKSKPQEPMFVASRILIGDGETASHTTGYCCCACSRVMKKDAKRVMAVSSFLIIELSKQMDKWIVRVAKTRRKISTRIC